MNNITSKCHTLGLGTRRSCIHISLRFNNKKAERGKDTTKKSKRYSNTLNLPKTTFPLSMKNGAAAQREVSIQKSKSFQSLYLWQKNQPWEKQFVLHDGPPYANGKTHVGHVVNKVLKDITNRYKLLTKHRVHYVAGWDCHGMPIEIKAITDQSGQHQKLSPMEIRTKAKAFAQETIKKQKTSFLRWGILADWDSIYTTYSSQYQAKQIETFYKIYEKGFIYRDYMPVYWSPSSQTALAEAELEYNKQHVSTSAFLRLPLLSLSSHMEHILGLQRTIFAAIWTTTPWTLPFNQAICFNSKLKYCFLEDAESKFVYVCEENFVDRLKELVPGVASVLATVEGKVFEGTTYLHPLKQEELPFLHADHVLSGKGTGLVHTAPAHGHDDFKIAVKHNLPKKCHVDGRGTFVSGVHSSLLGKTVGVDANEAVLSALSWSVLRVEDFEHSYPYDWRTKQPVIIRASKQWFVDALALRAQALECLHRVAIFPPQSEHGMMAELNSRPYWCISRQRSWGVPIPIFYHKLTGEPLVTKETVAHIAQLVRDQGPDIWWELPMSELLPNDLLAGLNKGQSSDFVRGNDILDIWFDSGVSWASVLADVGYQADVYLEGIDQYKGWFQTSLLTSVAVRGEAPYRNLITHGFATDENGKKMSKSVGNVIDPDHVINGNKGSLPSYGVDVLRWWVAHSQHHAQIMLGPSILQQFQEDVFKVRKCARYLLGNLFNFDPESDLLEYSQLTPMDKHMLYMVYHTFQQVTDAFENWAYYKVLQLVEKFVYADLSSFYISNTRDRCYCSATDSQERRSALTVQYHVTSILARAIAPVIPHLAEEIHQHLPGPDNLSNPDTDSIFKLGWYDLDPSWADPRANNLLSPVFAMRRTLMEALDVENPLEFDILIYSSPSLHNVLKEIQPEQTSSTSSLCEIFQTSHVTVLDKPPLMIPEDADIVQGTTRLCVESPVDVDYKILLTPATQHLCERCRRYTSAKSTSPCERCLHAIAQSWSN